jgi:hypothetical protein
VGDEDRVRQILVILLSNALKFTDPGGTITVSCGTSPTPDEEATLGGDGPWTFIRVTDTGIGISEAEAETVFQPFVQADPGNTRKQGGAGLGLAIGLELARRMGGDLTLRSAPGEGSCFTLWLPPLPSLKSGLCDSDPLVRSHSAWALGRVGSASAVAALEKALSAETDHGVMVEIGEALAAAWSTSAAERGVPAR